LFAYAANGIFTVFHCEADGAKAVETFGAVAKTVPAWLKIVDHVLPQFVEILTSN